MSRSIDLVIARILEVIPEEEIVLRTEITNYTQNLWNVAPELLSNGEYYLCVQRILSTYIGKID